MRCLESEMTGVDGLPPLVLRVTGFRILSCSVVCLFFWDSSLSKSLNKGI